MVDQTMPAYKEYKELNFARIAEEILTFWNQERIFEKSVTEREGRPSFTFYEGPPSANGTPGIHHVMARTVKDIFCRYKTLKGFQVKRKGGWDTHGLPVELQVEKLLGITKEDIGRTISVEEYNRQCRETVMKYKDQWDDLTRRMGYWVDLDDPYITYKNEYIESLWWILKELHKKGLLYKGYTVQPFSPAAGTGLSSHELNLPGCYREVKDTSIVAQFSVVRDARSEKLFASSPEVFMLAWTTTPWTLPSNTALAVGEGITYVQVNTFNPYTFRPVSVILAKDLVSRYFSEKARELDLGAYKPGDKLIPFSIVAEWTGKELVGVRYNQLMPYVRPLYQEDNAFKVVAGDFVTTEDGTGIVHTSPTFGSDDYRVAKQNDIPPLTVRDETGNEVPTVDRLGRFVTQVGTHLQEGVRKYNIKTHKVMGPDDFYVKNYTDEDETHPDYKSTDVIISIILKEENKAFKVEKYEHTYPHCWRTDKPVLYYPLDSWFIKTTTFKDRMVELNKTINWKPESTGTGRFGNWLENLVDWNLSRSRYWGTPLPIWRTTDKQDELCIGSMKELKTRIDEAIASGRLSSDEQKEMEAIGKSFVDGTADLHRPYVDQIVLISEKGEKMYRELDLIDVWFDSGAMPYAQWHYPFENADVFERNYPADFIAEGVDQTRGWFFTLHAISVLLFDRIAFKNVISNGLVLDKNGNKMSKRLGNVVNPFETIDQYGPDVVRWYLIENSAPWDNLKFSMEGVVESQRRFFGTLLNTYSFFALYANIDGYVNMSYENPDRRYTTHLDRWILSRLQTLVKEVTQSYEDYEPTKAARAIQTFVNDQLSNWYVRLNRKRFWKGDMTDDKRAAYDTLFECIVVVAQLMAPIAPFFSEWLYKNLTDNLRGDGGDWRHASIHLTTMVSADERRVDEELEKSMDYAQHISSLVHSLRKQAKVKVRTPLQKILLPILDKDFAARVQAVEEIIKSEVNVKEVVYIEDTSDVVIKKVKPNFPVLGKRYGPRMKEVVSVIESITREELNAIEKDGSLKKGEFSIAADDVIITSEDIPGWSVASEDGVTVALDISVTDDLRKEGMARDFVNRVQNLRKDMGLAVLDKILIDVADESNVVASALDSHRDYIRTETQALALNLNAKFAEGSQVELDDYMLRVKISLHQ